MTWVGARQLLRRMRPGTIRMRLALLAAVITLVPLTAAAIPIARTERTAQMQNADRKAAEMSWAIDTMISGLHGRNPPDCTRSFQPAHESPDKDVSLCRPTQKTRESSGNLSLIPWTDPVRGPIPIRQIIYRKYVHAGVDDIAVTQSLEAEQTRLNTIVWFLIGAMVGMTLVVSGTTWFAAGRVLRPVEAIRADFADLSAHHLDRRVPVPRTGNEIARLAITMNSTLDRLQGAVEQQRQFTADASHELRTPLACLRTELELALHHPHTADWPRVVRAAHDDTLRLQTLTTDLLLLARLDAGPTDQPPGPTIDLTDLVRDETSRRTPPPHLTLTVHVGPEPITVNGQQALLARVLGNLLDNAERHAAGTITVRLAYDTEHRQAVLEVLDDGLGIPSEDHQRIFERFSRLDDARTRDGGGAGLGLAIAARIATTHHGTLTIVPSSQGAHFLLRLPTSTPPQDPLTTAAFSSPTEAT
ncbi:HAMP domain-containing histidine kinase [Streptomyces prunicolor]|uniref:sensor histidine kinase n=1 Tax=Streptomyces prunicolor TaxID=67348 RepID=UPI0038693853|nr:HAMP domain-containing histidine kinase [Streptomyces prunicolor]